MCDQAFNPPSTSSPVLEISPGGRAGEEGDRRGDVFRLAVVTDRNHLALGFRLFSVFRVHIAVGRPRMDKVNGDPARAQITRRATGQGVEGGLGHGVNRDARHGHAVSQTAADVDDSSAIDHMHQRFTGGDDHPRILTLISASMSASVMDSSGPPRAIPALLTRMSSPPRDRAAWVTAS